jgi:hypothetical protein
VIAAASGIGAFVLFAVFMSEGQLLRLGGEVAPQQTFERPVWLVVTTAGGALGVAGTALWLALWRGRSMLGRSRRWLLYGGALIPISLFAWKVSCSMAFGDAMVAWPGRPGLRCLSLSLLVAVGPLLSFLAMRRSAPVHPALNGAAMGLAAGSCAWAAADPGVRLLLCRTWCSATSCRCSFSPARARCSGRRSSRSGAATNKHCRPRRVLRQLAPFDGDERFRLGGAALDGEGERCREAAFSGRASSRRCRSSSSAASIPQSVLRGRAALPRNTPHFDQALLARRAAQETHEARGSTPCDREGGRRRSRPEAAAPRSHRRPAAGLTLSPWRTPRRAGFPDIRKKHEEFA